jgi:hypothetical protein
MVSTASRTATCLLVVVLLLPMSVAGQAGRVAVGTLLGAAGGSCLSLALTTAAARAGHYAYSPGQGIWRAVPIPVGAVAGGVLGYQGEDRLRDSVWFGIGGLAAGSAVGAVLGGLAWEGSEGVWSGALIGSGVGLLAGGLWGALRGAGEADEHLPAVPAIAIRIPYGP